MVLRVRAQNRFTGLYIAGVSAEGLWEGFDVSLAARKLFVGETQSWGPEGRQIRVSIFVIFLSLSTRKALPSSVEVSQRCAVVENASPF